MCGIVGVAIPEQLARTVDQASLIRMRDALMHRGPDESATAIAG
jgi:asparagine synthetase B (glutamine-hydrolysing)